tara:strand:+ start:875 stop:1120 length:246 start_codon:yes stop_codon:yes gene_type:complete
MNSFQTYNDYNKSSLEKLFFNKALIESDNQTKLKLYLKVLLLNKNNQDAIINSRTVCQLLNQTQINNAKSDASDEIKNNIC